MSLFFGLFDYIPGMMHTMDHDKINEQLAELAELEGIDLQLSYDGESCSRGRCLLASLPGFPIYGFPTGFNMGCDSEGCWTDMNHTLLKFVKPLNHF
jgi:hypothetical protein